VRDGDEDSIARCSVFVSQIVGKAHSALRPGCAAAPFAPTWPGRRTPPSRHPPGGGPRPRRGGARSRRRGTCTRGPARRSALRPPPPLARISHQRWPQRRRRGEGLVQVGRTGEPRVRWVEGARIGRLATPSVGGRRHLGRRGAHQPLAQSGCGGVCQR
jgi:hypothetical protein